jgi:hypothetical protein
MKDAIYAFAAMLGGICFYFAIVEGLWLKTRNGLYLEIYALQPADLRGAHGASKERLWAMGFAGGKEPRFKGNARCGEEQEIR